MSDLMDRALASADLNVLRMCLIQATGDQELIDLDLVETFSRGGAQRSVTVAPEHRDLICEKTRRFLADQAGFRPSVPDDARLRSMLEVMTGEGLSDQEFAFRRDEIAFDDFPHAANWTAGRPESAGGYHVVIVGAGFSGLAMAAQLERLGVPYVVLERRHELGGTWSINTYPDARVDTPSVLYQYNFVKNHPWSEHYARGTEVRAYLDKVARDLGIFGHIRFGADVKAATFDESTSRWTVRFSGEHGDEIIETNAVVSASGLFSTPRELDFPGIEAFEGQVFHTTQWDESREIDGKRVAVIGNGSTGVQLLARVAERAERVEVFQRTPQWICPAENYGAPLTQEQRWLLDSVPYYWNWLRYSALVPVLGTTASQERDEQWQAEGGAVSEANDALRDMLTQYIRDQLDGRQDLVEQLVPDYAPMARRLIVDNNWYRTLLRDDVELVTGAIEQITPRGIRTADGVEHEVDVIIAAVGFAVTKYVYPAEYTGQDGLRLESAWEADGPRAYKGVAVPGFPNFFIMYGPNAQPRASAFVSIIELWSQYIGQSIVRLIEGGHRQMVVSDKAFERYNEDLEAASEAIIWATEGPVERNYYVHASGRQQVNAPWTAARYHELMTEDDAVNYNWA